MARNANRKTFRRKAPQVKSSERLDNWPDEGTRDFSGKQFFWALGSGTALGAALLTAIALNIDKGETYTPAKAYMADVVIGANDGMRSMGWDNPDLSRRVGVIRSDMAGSARPVVREGYLTGYSQALAGEWSEPALNAYVEVIEAPLKQMADKYLFDDLTLGDSEASFKSGYLFEAIGGNTMLHLDASAEDKSPDGIASEARLSGFMQMSPLHMAVEIFGIPPEDNFVTDAAYHNVRDLSFVDERSRLVTTAQFMSDKSDSGMSKTAALMIDIVARQADPFEPAGELAYDPFAAPVPDKKDSLEHVDPDDTADFEP